jgi:transposase
MAKKAELSEAVIALAKETVRKAKEADLLRMAQTVFVPTILDASDTTTGQIIGRSRTTVVRLRKRFRGLCQAQESHARNWGGRRYGYMTVEEEGQFLSEFLEKAKQGGILVVSVIKRALEARVGHKVAKTTVYRMLDRHDWRTIIPRPRHPKSNAEAQEGFKKTPENSD